SSTIGPPGLSGRSLPRITTEQSLPGMGAADTGSAAGSAPGTGEGWAQGAVGPMTRIRQHHTGRNARPHSRSDLLQRNPRLGLELGRARNAPDVSLKGGHITRADSPKEATAVVGRLRHLKGGQSKAATRSASIDLLHQFFTYFLMSLWSSDAA